MGQSAGPVARGLGGVAGSESELARSGRSGQLPVHLAGVQPGRSASVSRVEVRGSRSLRSSHAQRSLLPRPPCPGWVAVLRLRRARPRRRVRHRRGDDLVLRDQCSLHPRLRSPLAGHPELRRHLHRGLDDSATGRCADRRVPLPGPLDRRQRRRPRTRHSLRALVAHGGRDRRPATRSRRHRERPRTALRTRNPTRLGRSNS